MGATVDPLFTLIQERPELEEQRSFVDGLYLQFRPYADKNFETELPLQFISRFWEMYLGCAFLNNGFDLIPRGDRPPGGTDLCVIDDGTRCWIEAVAPSSGEGPDSVADPESQHGLVSEDKIVLRFCQAIKDKHEKYTEYLANGLLHHDDRFLVAASGARIPHADGGFFGDVPYPIQAVLPIGLPTVTIDDKTHQKVDQGFEYRNAIIKKSDAAVPTDIFLNPEYEAISGLLFSNVHPFYCREASFKPVTRVRISLGALTQIGFELEQMKRLGSDPGPFVSPLRAERGAPVTDAVPRMKPQALRTEGVRAVLLAPELPCRIPQIFLYSTANLAG